MMRNIFFLSLSILTWALLSESYLYKAVGKDKWTEVKDIGVRQISVGYDDAVWGLTNDQEVFTYVDGHWTRIPGSIQSISAINKHIAWGIGPENAIFRFTNGKWYQVNGQLSSISVTRQQDLYGEVVEHIWGISPTNRLWYCRYRQEDRFQCKWSSLRSPKKSRVVAIASASGGDLYALIDIRDANGYQMYWYHKGEWTVLDQRLVQISSTAKGGKVIGHDAKGNIHILNHGEKAWSKYGNLGIKTGFVASGGNVWFLSREKAESLSKAPEAQEAEYW
ncbi:hypothetical protein K7432_006561 [Basidiobolus ranarum]|uniref:Lectin n=1 Tax=Basidiobolus ranarum TaxID=34480 RepID=A0ABR2WUP7_9FUNG